MLWFNCNLNFWNHQITAFLRFFLRTYENPVSARARLHLFPQKWICALGLRVLRDVVQCAVGLLFYPNAPGGRKAGGELKPCAAGKFSYATISVVSFWFFGVF